ncbi:MAG: DNA starvation/stationary phase protection protein [Bryobacterales bacterium]|nr:DNA starvation/stationary phase protection protein [Bryobacterales bacterium]
MAKTLEQKLNIGLEADATSAIVEILSKILADQHILYVKSRNFHWNVTGPNFSQLHKLYEDQYNQLAEAIDSTAERIRMLGAPAPGSMADFLAHARLSEHRGHSPRAGEMTAILLADHEAIIRNLREDIDTVNDDLGDAGTADFLTGLIQDHEKAAWFLRAHLE